MSANPYAPPTARLDDMPAVSGASLMRIEYELKFRDYALFSIAHQFLSVTVQVFYVGSALLLFSALQDVPLGGRVLAALLAYGAIWAAQVVFTVIYLVAGKNRTLLTRHAVEVQQEAFYDETRYARTFHYWHGIHKVIRRPGFVAVYINAGAAHIIPSRAFLSSGQLTQFVEGIRERIKAHAESESGGSGTR